LGRRSTLIAPASGTDDYDTLAGQVGGRIVKIYVAPDSTQWMCLRLIHQRVIPRRPRWNSVTGARQKNHS
jgi:hypothetical protein